MRKNNAFILFVFWNDVYYYNFMTPVIISIISISIIFLGTTLGSAFVFFFKKNFSDKTSNIIIGFASGVMIAAAFFGLLLPSIDQSKELYENIAVLPVIIGFLLGGLLLFLIDKLVPHVHLNSDKEEGLSSRALSKNSKFILAVTIHNIPEGLAVGFLCGIAITQNADVSMYAALSLAIGIAIQNVPEGAAVSIPLLGDGMNKTKSFLFGTLTGLVEPIFAIIGLFIASSLTSLMPWLLAFSAGAMIYVTIDELLPEARKGGYHYYGLWSFMIGFTIMMLLEIIL